MARFHFLAYWECGMMICCIILFIMRLLKWREACWLESASKVPMVFYSEGRILLVFLNDDTSRWLVHCARGMLILMSEFDTLLMKSSSGRSYIKALYVPMWY